MLALTAVITSCSDSNTYRIGVSQCSGGAWREKVNNEMLAAQHLYEHAVKVSIACAYDDTERQIQKIDSLADSGIDLLVIAPNESAPLSAALQRVRQRGIPVVCFDRRVADQNCTAFIGGSNVEAGHAVGVNVVDVAHALTRLGQKPRVLEVTALMSSSPARERHQGFAQALKGHDELEYLCRQGDWSSEETYRIVKKLILEGRQPDIVFCHNDGMATGAYKAVVETQTTDRIQIFGISFVRSTDHEFYYTMMVNPEDENHRKVNFEQEGYRVTSDGDGNEQHIYGKGFIEGIDGYWFERPADNTYKIDIYTDNSVLVMYINDVCAYTQRIYGIQKNCWSVNNYGGSVTVSDVTVSQY